MHASNERDFLHIRTWPCRARIYSWPRAGFTITRSRTSGKPRNCRQKATAGSRKKVRSVMERYTTTMMMGMLMVGALLRLVLMAVLVVEHMLMMVMPLMIWMTMVPLMVVVP